MNNHIVDKYYEGYAKVDPSKKKASLLSYLLAFFSILLLVFVVYKCYDNLTQDSLLSLSAALFLSFFFSDFMSGVVHWFADNYGSADTPLIGKSLIAPFRYHHIDPTSICQHSFMEKNGNTLLLTTPILFLPSALIIYFYPEHWFTSVFLLISGVLLTFTNQIHSWSHTAPHLLPRSVLVLQKMRLILPREHHALHHRLPHDKSYCITNGHVDKALALVGFWRFAEFLIKKIFKQDPEWKIIQQKT